MIAKGFAPKTGAKPFAIIGKALHHRGEALGFQEKVADGG
jgi:hypothetical protein